MNLASPQSCPVPHLLVDRCLSSTNWAVPLNRTEIHEVKFSHKIPHESNIPKSLRSSYPAPPPPHNATNFAPKILGFMPSVPSTYYSIDYTFCLVQSINFSFLDFVFLLPPHVIHAAISSSYLSPAYGDRATWRELLMAWTFHPGLLRAYGCPRHTHQNWTNGTGA